jgi:alkanesulfonate monooxygenase SsuD/methylene tetrahydromethanopterin reductase-like flavin-dependent oxidoreductase (luciferase family)
MAGHVMRYGIVLPGGTATEQLDQAVLAEQAGWDGVFVWEAAYGVDAWSLLAAIAVRTARVRLGTMLTPLPWRRPWKVASQVATLDQLSGGRAILAVGVGAVDTDLPDTAEVTDLRGRAERLDEGIDLIRTLWEGGTSYHGQHYHYDTGRLDLTAAARPVAGRIPLWVVGVWPRTRSGPWRGGWPSTGPGRGSTSWPTARPPPATGPWPRRWPAAGPTPGAHGGWRPGGRCPTTRPSA